MPSLRKHIVDRPFCKWSPSPGCLRELLPYVGHCCCTQEKLNMSTKDFSTLAVVGAYSGICLEDKGFGAIRDVAAHLFSTDGDMSDAGILASKDKLASALLQQHPQLKELPVQGDWRALAATAKGMFGEIMSVEEWEHKPCVVCGEPVSDDGQEYCDSCVPRDGTAVSCVLLAAATVNRWADDNAKKDSKQNALKTVGLPWDEQGQELAAGECQALEEARTEIARLTEALAQAQAKARTAIAIWEIAVDQRNKAWDRLAQLGIRMPEEKPLRVGQQWLTRANEKVKIDGTVQDEEPWVFRVTREDGDRWWVTARGFYFPNEEPHEHDLHQLLEDVNRDEPLDTEGNKNDARQA